jgi:hypothetical protein
MKLLLEFTEGELENFRTFSQSVEKQLGNVYVGTNSLCVYYDYPKELAGLLRPTAGNPYVSDAELAELKHKLKSGKLVFEIFSSKPQK